MVAIEFLIINTSMWILSLFSQKKKKKNCARENTLPILEKNPNYYLNGTPELSIYNIQNSETTHLKGISPEQANV